MVRKVGKRCAPNSTEGGDANEQSGPVPANEAVAASTLLRALSPHMTNLANRAVTIESFFQSCRELIKKLNKVFFKSNNFTILFHNGW